MKINFKNGCKTPETVANEKRRGTLIAIKRIDSKQIEFYEYKGECWKILSINDEVVQVSQEDINAIRVLLACNKLQFGGF